MAERMVGKQAPRFEMEAVLASKEFGKVSLEENMKNDKWTVLFFYPMDFTFVCPTEITAMSDRYDEFEDLDADVIGVSTDTIHTHLAWINTDRKENGLGKLKYPLAADTNHEVSREYGVLIEEEGVALRGLFIINPEGELNIKLFSIIILAVTLTKRFVFFKRCKLADSARLTGNQAKNTLSLSKDENGSNIFVRPFCLIGG